MEISDPDVTDGVAPRVEGERSPVEPPAPAYRSMSKSFRRRVYELVDVPPNEDGSGRTFDWFDVLLAAFIILNVASVMLETVESLETRWQSLFVGFERISVAVFTLEYALRLWSCTADRRYAPPFWGRLRFATRPLLIVDLLAIAPSFLPYASLDLRFLRVVRLLRILRVLKLGRYSDSVVLLGRVLRNRRGELFVMFLTLVMLLILSSGLIYHAEHDAQPDKFSSIPAALWWSVITLTTIGYGDVYPITPWGKVLGGLIAISGIGIVALPTAIVASGFAEELRRQRKGHDDTVGAGAFCPHCGKCLVDP